MVNCGQVEWNHGGLYAKPAIMFNQNKYINQPVAVNDWQLVGQIMANMSMILHDDQNDGSILLWLVCDRWLPAIN